MDTSVPADEFRVLVVDDNRDAARTLSMLLKAWGFSSRFVVDSREAIATGEEFRPHCIISDLDMPRIDGYQLAREFRLHALFKKTPLIAHSANPDDRRAIDAGFNYSLTKPQDVLVIGDLLREIQIMNRRLNEAEKASQQGTAAVAEVRELMKEVRDDVKEIKGGLRADVNQLKTDLREVKQEVKDLREELRGEGQSDTAE